MAHDNSSEQLDHIRHSLAHLLAAAVLKEFPDAKLGIGPTVENGFYYDFLLPRSITPDDLKTFEKTMRSFVNKKLPFTGREVSPAEARKIFADQPFKLDLINEFAGEGEAGKKQEKLTVYETGDVFMDLCRGGHVENTSEIPADGFKLDKIAGAYWRGDEKNQQLQRIYGLAFESKEKLKEYEKMLEEAKKRDHRKARPATGSFYILRSRRPRPSAHGRQKARSSAICSKIISGSSATTTRLFPRWTSRTSRKKSSTKLAGTADKVRRRTVPRYKASEEKFYHEADELPAPHADLSPTSNGAIANSPALFRTPQRSIATNSPANSPASPACARSRRTTAHVFCRVSQIEEEVSRLSGTSSQNSMARSASR